MDKQEENQEEYERTEEEELPFGDKCDITMEMTEERWLCRTGYLFYEEQWRKNIRKFIRPLAGRSWGKIFRSGLKCQNMEDILYLYISFCWFVSYELISDRTFARFIYVLEPLIKLANSTISIDVTRIHENCPWNTEFFHFWVISILYGDFMGRGIGFQTPEACEIYFKSITIPCSDSFNQVFAQNLIRSDWWRCNQDERTAYRAMGEFLLYRRVENTNGDLWLLDRDGKRKMLASGIDNFALDREKGRVFIRYMEQKGHFGCYNLRTGRLKQTNFYPKEKATATVWTDRLTGELLSDFERDQWENYAYVRGCRVPICQSAPISCTMRRMHSDLFHYLASDYTFSEIKKMIEILEASGVVYHTREAALLKRTIDLMESLPMDLDYIKVDSILESMYEWKKLIMPFAENANLMDEEFLSVFEETFHKNPVVVYWALKNRKMDFLIKEGYIKPYEYPHE